MSDRILRLQHVQIRVPDLELCTAYYTEVLGLIETAHEENRVFLKCWDEHEHHSVVLRQAPTYGLDHMSFKVTELEDLDYFTERVEGVGIPVKRYGAGELGHLERHVVEAERRCLAQDDGVVLVLVPALEEHAVPLVRRLDQAHHLGVVRRAQLEVRHPDLHVLQAKNAIAHRDPYVWKRRKRCATTFS